MEKKVGKSIFLGLSILSLAIVFVLVFFLWYLISPRIYEANSALILLVKIALGLFLLVIMGGLFLIVLSSVTEKDFLFPHNEKQVTLKILFPINLFLGHLFGISKDKVRESFVEVNNSLIKATHKRIKNDRILILLSQCLQNYDCPNRVTADCKNCKKCGKCVLGDIIELGEKEGASIAVATGGTLARKVVIDTKPTAIVAVACQRDLTSGIQDVYPIPVYGVLNQRPYGPCFNTQVDLEKLRKALQFISNGRI